MMKISTLTRGFGAKSSLSLSLSLSRKALTRVLYNFGGSPMG
jgi:hypothetical protein